MTFSIMLWMPSWGGMINGLMTLSGAWDKLRTDPGRAPARGVGRLLRHVDLRGAGDEHQGGQLALPLHRLDHRPRALRRARLGRHGLLRRHLLPGAVAVEPARALLHAPRRMALLDRHHRHPALHHGHVGVGHHAGPDVARLRQARLPAVLVHRDRRGDEALLRDPRHRRAAVRHRLADHGLQRLAHGARRRARRHRRPAPHRRRARRCAPVPAE